MSPHESTRHACSIPNVRPEGQQCPTEDASRQNATSEQQPATLAGTCKAKRRGRTADAADQQQRHPRHRAK